MYTRSTAPLSLWGPLCAALTCFVLWSQAYCSQNLIELHNLAFYNQDEFSRVDCAIHKGQYVLTTAPPREINLMDNSPILDYADKSATVIETEIEPLASSDGSVDSIAESTATNENTPPVLTPAAQDVQYDFGTMTEEPERTVQSAVQPEVTIPTPLKTSTVATSGLQESRWRAPSIHDPAGGRAYEHASTSPAAETRPITSQWSSPVERLATRTSSSSHEAWTLAGSASAKMTKPRTTLTGQVMGEGAHGIARFDVDTGKQLHLKVCAGDEIRVGKHVSADTWNAINLRTNARGHIKMELLQPKTDEGTNLPSWSARSPLSKPSGSRFQPLDAVERENASQWDVGPSSTKIHSASSDSLEEKRDTSVSSQTSREMFTSDPDKILSMSDEQLIQMTPRQIEYLVETKLAQLMAKRSLGSSNPLASSGSRWETKGVTESRNPHSKAFMIRDQNGRQPCWFFVTPGQECRFTASECKDLHVDLDEFTAGYEPQSAGDKIQFTCYYWATPGKTCSFKDDECKYAHYWTAKSQVAPRPMNTHKRKERYVRSDLDDWRPRTSSVDAAAAWGAPAESEKEESTSDVQGWMAGTPGVSMPWGRPEAAKAVEEQQGPWAPPAVENDDVMW